MRRLSHAVFYISGKQEQLFKADAKTNGTHLVGSDCLVADLPVYGAFDDARHQLGNVFVLLLFTRDFLNCKLNKWRQTKYTSR